MRTGKSARIVVVGGGVTGLSTAWWLAQRGIDVVVFDRGIVGWEASGRNGGGVGHDYSPLFAEEQRLWPDLSDMLGYPTEFRPNRLAIALDAAQYKRSEDYVQIAKYLGKEVQALDLKELREFVPFVGDDAVGGFLLKFGGHANPQRTVQAYAWALQDLGGTIMQNTEVRGFEVSGGTVKTVLTDSEVFGCDGVVIAAGPQTRPLLAKLGVVIPLALARVEMIVTAPVPLMRVGIIGGNGIYGRQTLRGNLAYGGGPHEWLSFEEDGHKRRLPTTPLSQFIAKRLQQLYPKLEHIRVIRSWAGIVENTPDGRPVLDRLPDFDNVVVGTMSSVGFGLSPASGRALSELALDGTCSFADLSSMKLSRFDGLATDWQAAKGWTPPERSHTSTMARVAQ